MGLWFTLLGFDRFRLDSTGVGREARGHCSFFEFTSFLLFKLSIFQDLGFDRFSSFQVSECFDISRASSFQHSEACRFTSSAVFFCSDQISCLRIGFVHIFLCLHCFFILFTHITNVIEQQGHVHKIVQFPTGILKYTYDIAGYRRYVSVYMMPRSSSFPPAFWNIPMILPGAGDILACTWCRTAGKYGRKPANIISKSARNFCFGAQTTHDTFPTKSSQPNIPQLVFCRPPSSAHNDRVPLKCPLACCATMAIAINLL